MFLEREVKIRLTFTDIKGAHLRNIGKSGSTDTDILADFKYSLGQRYQLILSRLASYINQDSQTTSTVAAQQYYSYPPGIVNTDAVTITIGSLTYTLSTIYDQVTWSQLNALQFQPSAIPQFYFPRHDDFGIWPIPQAVYTCTFYAFQRDRNLLVDDYTTGTATLTNGSTTLTGNSTTFTPGMVGRWFEMTDTATAGHGYWYRVAAYVGATELTLNMPWTASNATTVTYRIGESPEIPEEAHILLPDGTAADFYSGMRTDITKATWWNNKFFTGDGNNSSREQGKNAVMGGLIGLIDSYANRDNRNLIYKSVRPMSPYFKIWATTLS